MLIFLILLVLGVVLASFYGYWAHWSFHQHWSNWFYRKHTDHHMVQYPPANFSSDIYRSSGSNDSSILFIIAFLPLCLAIAGVTFIFSLPLAWAIALFIGFILYGVFSSYLHEQFHLTKSWLDRFDLFKKYRHTHYIHHLDVNLNHGIIFMMWDRLFGSFDDTDDFLI